MFKKIFGVILAMTGVFMAVSIMVTYAPDALTATFWVRMKALSELLVPAFIITLGLGWVIPKK